MNKVTSTITYGNNVSYDNMDDWQRESHPWTVVLRYQGRQMTINFWTGQLVGEPDTCDVLTCIAPDASGFDNAGSFEEWASEYGYDADSREAEKIYKAVEKQTHKLRRLLDDDYETIIYTDEDELKAFTK